jgi:DNA gyrase subunit A
VSEIREMGRATQGVTLIAVEDGTKLSGLQRIVEADVDDEAANGDAESVEAGDNGDMEGK